MLAVAMLMLSSGCAAPRQSRNLQLWVENAVLQNSLRCHMIQDPGIRDQCLNDVNSQAVDLYDQYVLYEILRQGRGSSAAARPLEDLRVDHAVLAEVGASRTISRLLLAGNEFFAAGSDGQARDENQRVANDLMIDANKLYGDLVAARADDRAEREAFNRGAAERIANLTRARVAAEARMNLSPVPPDAVDNSHAAVYP